MPAWPGKAEPAATSFVLCPGPAGKRRGCIGRKGSRSLTHGWRELEGETAKSERVNDRKIAADGKEGPGDRSGEAYPYILKMA